MKYQLKHIFVIVAFAAVVITSVLAVKNAVSTRAVVSEDLPNGTRIRIIQTFSGEPFDTAIYFDDGDGKWRWYYYDHEDWYWGRADTTYADGVLTIDAGRRSVVFDTRTGNCIIDGSQLGKTETEKSTRIVELPGEF